MPETAPTIDLQRIGLRYGRGPEVLSGVDLRLAPGSFTFLTGASGAGKSSLLKLCYLSLKPSRGLINLFGQDVSTLKPSQLQVLRRRIGVVLQDFRLIDHLSVWENVALPLRVAGRARADYLTDVNELLSWVGLGHRVDALPPTLSGGEKQRCAIARAIIAKPDLLIADEPTGNVDPAIGARLLRLFAEMNRMGATVLIATHDLGLIDEVSARTVHLADGKLGEGLGPLRAA
ncbi:cell division ATP-binding protein FtsE [uncultured Algimonas sp.]|uniref:cell division ATP-binding protein FtsE n=1 Tax=uncultured Algimonas sp. TaxID=1547920 RepID=UPI002613BC0D|nr:cell division ATP-binding protein FtsE [uncultured Algimonas sp.]